MACVQAQGTVAVNGYEYHFHGTRLTWLEAYIYCKEKGGELATATNKFENDAIFSVYPDAKIDRWLGLQREFNWDGPFSWVDGTPFTIQSDYAGCTAKKDCLWSVNEPNSSEEDQQYCVVMGNVDECQHGPAWYDVDCFESHFPVCQRRGKMEKKY